MQNSNLDSNTYYSIQIDKDGNKYVKVDTDQNIFSGVNKNDYNKIAKMYMQDYLMGKTQLSENDNAIIDRRNVNKYTNPGKTQLSFLKSFLCLSFHYCVLFLENFSKASCNSD